MAAKIRGASVVALIDTTPTADTPSYHMVAFQKTCTLTMAEDTIETTNKESGLWKEYITGNRDWAVEADGMIVETDTGIQAVENAWLAASPQPLRLAISTPANPNGYWTGTAIIKSLKYTAADNGVYTAAISFTGTGALTRSVS
jgi:TP901-1 family phage major tail protein